MKKLQILKRSKPFRHELHECSRIFIHFAQICETLRWRGARVRGRRFGFCVSPKLCALWLLVFTLPACASGSTTIDLTMDEFSFTPTEFTVPAGQKITINAVNEGAVIHELAVMKFGATVGEDFGDEDDVNIYWAVKVEPGGSITQTFTAPDQPGEYQVVCGIPGHFMAGMVGKLIVVADE